MLETCERIFDKVSNIIGHICGVLMIVMTLNVFYNVIMRYFFKQGSIGMQELEWHFFSLIILFGISYALKEDAHVRVDVLYERFTPKNKALVNVVGGVIFLLPICILIATGSTEFVLESYRSGEGSGDPGGLAYRWIIKSMIPISFYLLIFISIGFILKHVNLYRRASIEKGV
jgi:TRAP-type mannitol/chloroaromatic compound transport system permease small subunit